MFDIGCVGFLKTYSHIKFNLTCLTGSFVTAVKPKHKYRFRAAEMLFSDINNTLTNYVHLEDILIK